MLGHEISGTVVELGPDTEPVRGVEVGATVVGAFIMPCGQCRQCERGRDDMCLPFFAQNRLKGTLYDGTTRLSRTDGTPLAMYSMAGLAEYSVVPINALAPLHPDVPEVAGAVLGCAFFTAYGAVHQTAALQAGRPSPSSPPGSGIQHRPAGPRGRRQTIIAVDISDEKLAAAKELGRTTSSTRQPPTPWPPYAN